VAVLAACGPREMPAPPKADGEGHAESLDQAKKLAAERGVPVLIDFWSPT